MLQTIGFKYLDYPGNIPEFNSIQKYEKRRSKLLVKIVEILKICQKISSLMPRKIEAGQK